MREYFTSYGRLFASYGKGEPRLRAYSTDYAFLIDGLIALYEWNAEPRYLFEAEQGLSHTRNRALREFLGDALLFTDDDVRLDEHWLQSYADILERFADCGFFGGCVKPGWTRGKPAWLRDENMPLIGGLLVSYQLGLENRMLLPED